MEFPYKESLCSAAKPGAPSRQVVTVPPTSSKMVPFVLLPLEIGKVDVEVRAGAFGIQDHVRKTLLVQVIDTPSPLLPVQRVGIPWVPGCVTMGGARGPRATILGQD